MANAPPPPPTWPDRRQVTVTHVGDPPGGFWLRFVAYFIDSMILSLAALVIVGIAAAIILSLGKPTDAENGSSAIVFVPLLAVVSLLAVNWLYEAFLTSSTRGATIGKQALGLRIIRADGAPLSFGRATARHFLKVLITPMTFLIGYLMAAFTARKRALHDVLADTLVIRSR